MTDGERLAKGDFSEPLSAAMVACMPEQIQQYAEAGRLLQKQWSEEHIAAHGHGLGGEGYCSVWAVVDELARLSADGLAQDKLGAVAVAAWLTLGCPALDLREYYRAKEIGRQLMADFEAGVMSYPPGFEETGGLARPKGKKGVS